jgi:hypothetical protein
LVAARLAFLAFLAFAIFFLGPAFFLVVTFFLVPAFLAIFFTGARRAGFASPCRKMPRPSSV